MPLMPCTHDGKPGWKFGQTGRCYVGRGAKAKARRQERAIRATGWVENQRAARPLRADPTRTRMLRQAFEREFMKRFNRLKRAIRELVVEEDAFGIGRKPMVAFNRKIYYRFPFTVDHEKILAFQDWLKSQVDSGILTVGQREVDNAYWRAYIEEGYRKGAGRAFDDVRKPYAAGYAAEGEPISDFYMGSRYEFLRSSFARPIATEKVRLLAGRVFTELKGVTEAMSTKMTRVLTDGLVQGKSPRDVARDLNKVVESIGKVRARAIARTETIRAHSEGTLDGLELLGVEKVGVMVEWSTTGDDLVCPLCASLQGVVMTIKEARGLIPRHPNCRCAFTPAQVGESTKGQRRGRSQVRGAIDRSIQKEIPASSRRSLREQKRRTTWPGADVRVKKKRPKSVLG